MHSRTRSLALCGLTIALITVGAAIILPLGPVPFTLQALMIMLALLILTPKEAIATVGGYLALGAIGLPVFSGLTGGFGALLGPTGGFLVGFFIGVLLAAPLRNTLQRLARRDGSSRTGMSTHRRLALLVDLCSLILLMVVYYSLGLLWFMYLTDSSVSAAFSLCVLPFIVPDLVKAAAALICVQPIRAALKRGQHAQAVQPGER
ncbi:MAG: biotin transporter BioY [Coriobacteriia bacterium]|nr:biotin transporter BioY [Coriobacteriia bacterium]